MLLAAFIPALAHADMSLNTPQTTHALQQALGASDHVNLLGHLSFSGFNIDSSFFSGGTSGTTPSVNALAFDSTQRLYALLMDGRYDFNYDVPTLSSPLHPYVLGGLGMATFGGAPTSALDTQSTSMTPLFRLGGGVTYRLGQQWNLSLDYKAGFAAPITGDQVFTGRGQQPVDLQSLNLGMSFAF
jgi:hypothetical protein